MVYQKFTQEEARELGAFKMHSVKRMLLVQRIIHTEILMEKTTLQSGIISTTNGWL